MTGEQSLIDRAVRGDGSAMEEILAIHRPVALRVARALLDERDAEDVTQEVMVRLATALPGFRGDAALRTWVYRVALNLSRDQLRWERRRPRVDLDSARRDDALVTAPDPDRSIATERLRTALEAAIQRLPSGQREAVTLRYISDLSYEEISRMTDTPLGTVASRVFRALKRLGNDLDPKHLEVLK